MSTPILVLLTVFVLAAFVGNEVISKVPSILHTPLMSGSNAIHGVILVGAMVVLGDAHTGAEELLGFLAVVLATLNVVGGFVVTDRMLEMFRGKAAGPPGRPGGRPGGPGGRPGGGPGGPVDARGGGEGVNGGGEAASSSAAGGSRK